VRIDTTRCITHEAIVVARLGTVCRKVTGKRLIHQIGLLHKAVVPSPLQYNKTRALAQAGHSAVQRVHAMQFILCSAKQE